MLEAQLLDPLQHHLAPMYGEIVHDEADVVEGVAGPELIKPDLELLDVDCLLELEYEVDSSFERDASEHSNSFSTILPVVDLDFIPLSGPFMRRNGLDGHHGLVQVDEPESLCSHLLQSLPHEAGLSPDSILHAGIVNLGDANLLLSYMVPPLDGSIGCE